MTKSRSNATAPNAKGTLVVGSGTDASSTLAVGTNNYVLTADSAEASGVKWAAVSGGDWVKLSAYTASSATASPISFDNVFPLANLVSGSYRYYKIIINGLASTGDVQMKLRKNGTDYTNSSYHYGINLTSNGGTNTIQNASSSGAWKICDGNTNGFNVDLTLYNPRLGPSAPYIKTGYTAITHSRASDRGGYNTGFFDIYYDSDGFSIHHAGNFEGTITIYGMKV